jgi:lipoprotein NlpI
MRLFRTMTLILCAVAGACQGTPPVGNSLNDEKALLKRGWSYVRDSESEKAIAAFTQVIALDPNNYDGYLSRGIAVALSGDDRRALGDFNLAKPLEPCCSYEAVTWFILASRRMHVTFGGALAVEAQEHEGSWPGSIMRFLLHVLSERELLDAAETGSSNVPIDKRRCQANFFIAEMYSIDGRPDQARFYLAKARDTCPVDLRESAAAWAELKRLQGSE